MNSGLYSSPLLESDDRRMDPFGSRLAIVLVKLQGIEWAGRDHNKTIMLKLILKLGGEIKILGGKIIL